MATTLHFHNIWTARNRRRHLPAKRERLSACPDMRLGARFRLKSISFTVWGGLEGRSPSKNYIAPPDVGGCAAHIGRRKNLWGGCASLSPSLNAWEENREERQP